MTNPPWYNESNELTSITIDNLINNELTISQPQECYDKGLEENEYKSKLLLDLSDIVFTIKKKLSDNEYKEIMELLLNIKNCY